MRDTRLVVFSTRQLHAALRRHVPYLIGLANATTSHHLAHYARLVQKHLLPALATSIENVPRGERWIHEIKFDGYRVQLRIANEAIKVYTRRKVDLGFDKTSAAELQARLKPLIRKSQPYAKKIAHKAIWVERS